MTLSTGLPPSGVTGDGLWCRGGPAAGLSRHDLRRPFLQFAGAGPFAGAPPGGPGPSPLSRKGRTISQTDNFPWLTAETKTPNERDDAISHGPSGHLLSRTGTTPGIPSETSTQSPPS